MPAGPASVLSMPDVVPTLVGPPGRSLELQPLRYEFALAPGMLHAPVTNDWDANWLVVRMAAADERRQWSSADPAFLTWDLLRLVGWLRAVADRERELAVYSALEPNLQLEALQTGTRPKIQAHFSQVFKPPTGTPSIVFAPETAALHGFADALEVAMIPFPIRIVENNGPAQRYLQQLEKGASHWTVEP